MDIRKYGNEYNLHSFWEGDIAYNESVMFLENEDGSVNDATLLCDATELLEVCSSLCDVIYEEGKDYELVDGKLRRLPGSRIVTMKRDEYFPPVFLEGLHACFESIYGGYIRCDGKHFFHEHQCFVTYRHNGPYTGFTQADKTALLPRTMQKLAAGEPVNLMFFGDSITTPANVSGNGDPCAPFMKSWPELVYETLHEKYPALTYTNTAVGGMASPWGVDVVLEKFSECVPDLAVIGFGMNDATGNMPPREFIGNICHMMEKARTLNPNMEFILIATMLPNPMAPQFIKTQSEHEPLFLALEHEGVAIMQMTSVHAAMLERKPYYDMTGNNINHPNDYLTRAYAQTLLRLLGC